MVQFTIIGGGIVGAFLARELSKETDQVLVIEKEAEPAKVQTIHNSALVHSPVMVPSKKGRIKAELARKGNRMYRELQRDWGIPVYAEGGLVVAMNKNEEALLEHMIHDAEKDGEAVYNHMTRAEILKAEPNLQGDVMSGLYLSEAFSADTTFITNYALAEARSRGAEIRTGLSVTEIDAGASGFTVYTSDGEAVSTRWVINAAGIATERIAAMVEEKVPYTAKLVKGNYYVLDEVAKGWARYILYPIPTHETKGVLVIPQPDGTTRLGPTAVQIASEGEAIMNREDEEVIRREVERMMKNVPYDQVNRHYTGIRSSLQDQDDFYIRPSANHPRFLHVAGIDSPGVTAAPAIAEYVARMIREIE